MAVLKCGKNSTLSFVGADVVEHKNTKGSKIEGFNYISLLSAFVRSLQSRFSVSLRDCEHLSFLVWSVPRTCRDAMHIWFKVEWDRNVCLIGCNWNSKDCCSKDCWYNTVTSDNFYSHTLRICNMGRNLLCGSSLCGTVTRLYVYSCCSFSE